MTPTKGERGMTNIVEGESPSGGGVEKLFGSEKDLFRLTGIPPRGWQKLRWLRKGPPYYKRPGSNRVYYKIAEVVAWLESNRVGPTR